MRLLYFNPETEYALASGASFYTPPAVVESMRRANQLLPEKWAAPGDVILVDDAENLNSDFRLVDWSMLKFLFEENNNIKVEPWGWNKALVRRFLDHDVPASFLPDESTIELIRQLAHRRTTVVLNSKWNEMVGERYWVDLPVELFSETECVDFLRGHNGCWMKAPWSSSGRGVINTAADMSVEQVRQWCRGIIRRQGSVLAEIGAIRIADFATEWSVESGVARYLGLSCFNTSNRGKYISNEVQPQSLLIRRFNEVSKIQLERAVEIQKNIIESTFEAYTGPLGIDMLVQTDGLLRPFVEVNLRRTMGMLSIL